MEKLIWSLWWQGEDNAPPPVRLCLASIRRNANGAKVIVLDKDTYQRYITLPEHILEKFAKGQISRTHLSDIIRMLLVRDHGGLWFDSTIYVNAPIPDEVFSLDFYSLKGGCLWTSFLFGGAKGAPLCKAMCFALDFYWKENESFIAYLMMDRFFEMFIEMSPSLHETVAAIPVYDGSFWDFGNRRNEAAELHEIDGQFQKLSYKYACKAHSGGGMTLYGKALQAYGFPVEDYTPNISAGSRREARLASQNIVRKAWARLTYVLDIAQTCREFGTHVAVWEFLYYCVGLLSRRFRHYAGEHLNNAVKDYLRETARRALAAAEVETRVNG